MNRQQAARYARWSAGVAILLVAITAGVYLERSWLALRERRKAPPPVPSSVERQLSALTFSKVQQDRTLFTVQASKSTEFKGSIEDLLEDVRITIFGPRGLRHDTIHTSQCRYSKDRGSIACAGDVSIDLLSAEDAARIAQGDAAAAARRLRVETSGVSFERESGKASTSQPVHFIFPGGDGQAVGVEYDTNEERLRLGHDVRLHLTAAVQQGPAGDLRLSGTSLEYRSKNREMALAGPVRADSQNWSLAAGELLLALDEQNRARRMDLSAGPGGAARPEVQSRRAGSPARLSSDTMTAQFDQRGSLSRLAGSGNVAAQLSAAGADTNLTAATFDLSYSPDTHAPRQLALAGAVTVNSRSPLTNTVTTARRLRTDSLRLNFAHSRTGNSTSLESAETLAPAALDWEESSATSPSIARSTRLRSDKLRVNFQPVAAAANSSPRMASAEATGNVQMTRTLTGKPEQTATARQATARFDPRGDWSEITLNGDVLLREAARTAQAAKAVFDRAAQSAQLSGKAVVADAAMRTTARIITFLQSTGELRAEGGVQSSDLLPDSGAVQLAPAPANLTADHLLANFETARALYSGHARLWQGASVLDADSIELQKNERRLLATGHVRAVFPEAAFSPNSAASAKSRSAVWRVQAGSLSYQDAEGRAHAEGQVLAQSATQKIQSAALDLFLAPSANRSARQVARALATGGVLIEQGARRGSAERGEYSAAEGKFVLSGGSPSLSDPQYGLTTGRQLTFFLASDTIIVESEKGSRTLTKHRVEK
ncbi:MAG: LPS export ABC transporter periplasmic protein LptC [Acidobacteriia bacterium]|nr:LPS export ABC transporter periplasmic protein LptC [Terriglobia bacterium]